MGFFTKLFGNDDVVKKSIEVIDEAFNTDQEVNEFTLQKLKLKAEVITSYAAYKIAQRYFMLIVTMPFMLAWFIVFIALLVNGYQIGSYTEVKNYILDGEVVYLVMLIASFYFGDTVINRFKKKESDK